MTEIDQLFQRSVQAHIDGDFSTAAGGYASVLQRNPRHSDAWHLAGLLAHQNGRSEDGLKQILFAIELNPENPEYHSNVAAILNKLKRPVEALEAAEKALAIDDAFGPAVFQKGVACTALDRLDDAIDSLEQSYESGFSDETVLRQIGETKQILGDMDGALEDIIKSLDLNPDNPVAYFQLSSFVRTGQYQFSNHQIQRIEQLVHVFQDDPGFQNRLHVALAVHFEQKKNFSRAFRHFQTAATSRRKMADDGVVSPNDLVEIADNMVSYFQPEVFEKYRGAGNESRQPVFVIGMPRSGTTLVQQILSQHSRVVGLGELTEIESLVKEKFSELDPASMERGMSESGAQWLGHAAERYLQYIGTKADDGEGVSERIVDKLPTNYLYAGWIRLMFPNATIINCVRDPRDVCLSCFCQAFESKLLQASMSSLESLANVYRSYWKIIAHWKQVLPGGIHTVNYERLIENPEEQVAELLGNAGLEMEEACLAPHASRSSVKTASVNQVRRPIYKTSRKKWMNYEEQLEPLTQLLQLEISEYEASQDTQETAGG